MKTPFRWIAVLLSLTLLWSALGWPTVPAASALEGVLTVNPPFTDALVVNVGGPTALAFTPDNRMLVTTQTGKLWIVQNGSLGASPAVDFATAWGSSRVCTNSERGLLGVAVDPEFTTNHFIYLFYTYRKPGGHCNNSGGAAVDANYPVNRVARFELSGSTVLTGTETVLVDNMPSPNGNHNAGDLAFGADGYLYITIGDGGCDYAGGGCAGSNNAARDTHVLTGKVLRVTRAGDIPPTNPFQGAGTGRCNVTGSTTAGQHCQETFAWGLRNPFRFAFDPKAVGTRFFINDVGQGVWEEIDEGAAGADYGWNLREGPCANGSSSNCGAPPAGLTNPVFSYRHGGNSVPGTSVQNCNSITGGAFVPADSGWPAGFSGGYLFSDYVCGAIFSVTESGGNYTAATLATALGSNSAVHLAFNPFNASAGLYYTTYAGGGQVRRITSGNDNPTAALSADLPYGDLSITFSAAGSSDPNGDPLTYDWTFGDGQSQLGSDQASVTHAYAATGAYTATLVVRDDVGGVSAPATLRVFPGDDPPVPVITSPASGVPFVVGQALTLTGSATDAQEGALPANRLTWEVRQWHVDITSPGAPHYHPYLPATAGNNLSVTPPGPEDLNAAALSYLEVRLTATDVLGLATTVTRTLEPNRITLTFNTSPANLQLQVNELLFTASNTDLTGWQGATLNLSAPAQSVNGQPYLLAPVALTVPAADGTYTATFVPAILTFLPVARR